MIVRRMSSRRAQDVDLRAAAADRCGTSGPQRHPVGSGALSPTGAACAQLAHEPGRTRRGVGNTGTGDREKGGTRTTVGGVGEVRHPVGAHAPGELAVGGQHLLLQGRGAIAVLHALGFCASTRSTSPRGWMRPTARSGESSRLAGRGADLLGTPGLGRRTPARTAAAGGPWAGLAATGFGDVEAGDRPGWRACERVMREEAAALDPGYDPALRSFRDEGVRSLGT